MKRILLLLIIYMTVLTAAQAQFHGQVVDATDGYGIPYATLTAADGHHSSVCDGDVFFHAQRFHQWRCEGRGSGIWRVDA